MNWETIIAPAFCSRLCMALLHSIWLTALLAVAVRAADYLLRRRSVEVRYAVSVALLLGCLVTLPLTFALVAVPAVAPATGFLEQRGDTLPSTGADELAPAIATGDVGDHVRSRPLRAARPQAVASGSTPDGASDPERAPNDWAPAWDRWSPWIAALYVFGVSAMLARLVRSVWTTHRLRLRAEMVHEGPLVDLLRAISTGWSMRVVPTLAQTHEIVVPMVVGLVRPTILLPVSATTALSVGELEMILTHELAHVRRHDMWVNLLQWLVETVLFFNPAVWYINRRISTLREFCCDEMTCRAVAQTEAQPRRRYAEALLRVVELGNRLSEERESVIRPDHSEVAVLPASGRSPSELRRRLAHLFGEPLREPMRLSRSAVFTLAALGILLFVGLATWRSEADPAVALSAEPPDAANVASEDSSPSEQRLQPVYPVVTGVVVDESGRPLRSALVRPITPFEVGRPTQTDEIGQFEVSLAPGRIHSIWARSADGSSAGHTPLESGTSYASTPVKIILRPSRRLAVLVVDADKRPVPGAQVEVMNPLLLDSRKTDINGRASFVLPKNVQVRWVIAVKPAVGFDYFENYSTYGAFNEAQQLPQSVMLHLDGAQPRKVRLVDPKGEPLAGLQVGFFPSPVLPGKLLWVNLGGTNSVVATSGEDGIASFRWHPRQYVESGAIQLKSKRYELRNEHWLKSVGTATEVTAYPRTSVRGRLIDETGKPISGAQVAADSFVLGGRGDRTWTDESGRYELWLTPNKEFLFYIADERWESASRIVEVGGDDPVDLEEFRIGLGTVVAGRVSIGARPASNVRIVVESDVVDSKGHSFPSAIRAIRTNASGSYTVRLARESYGLRIRNPIDAKEHYSRLDVEGQKRIVHDIQLGFDPDVEMAKPPRIDVTVVSERLGIRTPTPNALVRVAGPSRFGRTDNSGIVSILASSEPQTVYAKSADGRLAGFGVIPKAGGEILLKPAATATGRIVDESGKPVGSGGVGCKFTLPGSNKRNIYLNTEVERNGSFRIDGLIPGTTCVCRATTSQTKVAVEFHIDDAGLIMLRDLVVENDPRNR